MATYTNITKHPVFNELDKIGLSLGLQRLSGEKNADYKQRLLDVFVNKAISSYMGLIDGITRKMGLERTKEFTIRPKDKTANPNAVISFKDIRCCIYPDYYGTPETFKEIDRWALKVDGGYTIQDLKDAIESYTNSNSPYFEVILEEDTDLSKRSMCLYEQKSVKVSENISIAGQGKTVTLPNTNIFKDSEYLHSQILKTKLASDDTTLLKDFKEDEYRIDYASGTLECGSAPESLAYIQYTYSDDEFEVYSTPVILNTIQSEQFKKLMFEQILQNDGVSYENGSPTIFGADIINELLSVHPTTYKA